MKNDDILSPEEMAEQLQRFARENRTSPVARRLRYEQGIPSATGDHPTEIEENIIAPQPELPAYSGGRYTWLCSDCGIKLTESQIGRVHYNRSHFSQLMTTECPVCRGVARNIQQMLDIRSDKERRLAETARRIRNGWLATGTALLLFLVFPGITEYLALLCTTLWVGPLQHLDMKSKMGSLLITGAITCIIAFVGYAVGLGFFSSDSRMIAYAAYSVVTIMFLIMAKTAAKIGSVGGGLIYNRS